MKKIKLPSGKIVSTFDLIIPGGNFRWYEATKHGRRIPETEQKERNIVAVAVEMENIRRLFGDRPILVNSWFRDRASNNAAGSNERSQHRQGRAVDFRILGIRASTIYKILDKEYPNDAVGRYGTFTHFDNRGTWARW